MNDYMCGRFRILINYFPDELNASTENDIHSIGGIVKYCPNGDSKDKKCNTDLEKINASLLWLFEQNIVKKIDSLNKEQPKVFIIYFMIWLSYMLTLKKVKNINNLKEFYENHIKNNMNYINCYNNGKSCSDSLKEITGYTNYKETIDNEIHFMTIDINNISKFYDAFKLLCNMYNEITKETPECDKYMNYADEFVKKYDDLTRNFNITKDGSYSQLFSTLLTDYNNLKNEHNVTKHCKSVTLPEINTKNSEHTEHTEHTELPEHSEVTSSSLSISNKIFIVLSIFSATLIFFGIAYKYSLFGFRKRSQKHRLREKLKK
ncbi:PIR protein [Plasmodium yoelii]|uniref:PIR protein n=2 Tax=Plasmodium yoelii TaxID=5861 RepID=A0AAE9WMQ2_PLAYO|nr:PIR protein [Plasmodium yoelii]WBY56486.1 PIR protein [Plasmodium yoelii yoelii]CDU17355.1 YIR protein [Plasmodium yoelii]VTZ76646.1 PIR protein [Plasmodium yoelii]|eukprot:XP_022811865.1 PIR protein [Plasmodium yoelii]